MSTRYRQFISHPDVDRMVAIEKQMLTLRRERIDILARSGYVNVKKNPLAVLEAVKAAGIRSER